MVAGGIGCGKSVVCKMLASMGFAVYDCDSRAKAIMDESCDIIDGIASEICREAIVENGGKRIIDRKRLAAEVFRDIDKLNKLNGLVHQAVKSDILRWRDDMGMCDYRHGVVFVETALLRQSGLDMMADEVWEVTAPLETRVQRAMRRDKSDRECVEARIRSQEMTSRERDVVDNGFEPQALAEVRVIENDGLTPVLPQVISLLADFTAS